MHSTIAQPSCMVSSVSGICSGANILCSFHKFITSLRSLDHVLHYANFPILQTCKPNGLSSLLANQQYQCHAGASPCCDWTQRVCSGLGDGFGQPPHELPDQFSSTLIGLCGASCFLNQSYIQSRVGGRERACK